jgi:hypothetical protein
VRKFLKKLGVTAQREIEKAVHDADAQGQLKNGERLPAKAVVTVVGIDLDQSLQLLECSIPEVTRAFRLKIPHPVSTIAKGCSGVPLEQTS